MATYSQQISASANDSSYQSGNGTFSATGTTIFVGFSTNGSLQNRSAALWFGSVPVDFPGSTVTAAVLSCRFSTQSGSAQLKVRAERVNGPATPTSNSDFVGRLSSLTTAGIDWDSISASGYADSPSLVSIFQELADNHSPTAILLFLLNDHADTGNTNQIAFHTIDNASGDSAILTIEYTPGEAGGIEGSLSATLDDATVDATGALAISGQLARGLDDATITASGALAITGALTATLDDATLSATGALVSGNTGALSATLEDAILDAAGALALSGALFATLDDATLEATGALSLGNTGVLVATLDDAILSASGALALSGALSATLDDATITAFGALAISGELSATLDDATLQAIGVEVLIVAIVQGRVRGGGGPGVVRGSGASGTVRGGEIVGQVRG